MSLEAELKANTAAVNALAEILTEHTELLKSGVSKAAASGGEKTTTKAPTKKAPAKKAPAKKKAVTLDTIKKEFGAYLSVPDEDENAEHAANCGKIIEHFGVERITLLDESDYVEALEMLAKFKEGEDPFGSSDDDDDDDGDGLL